MIKWTSFSLRSLNVSSTTWTISLTSLSLWSHGRWGKKILASPIVIKSLRNSSKLSNICWNLNCKIPRYLGLQLRTCSIRTSLIPFHILFKMLPSVAIAKKSPIFFGLLRQLAITIRICIIALPALLSTTCSLSAQWNSLTPSGLKIENDDFE